jgi:hypothetical protein
LVGFEVFTAVLKKSSVFWDIMPCSPLKVRRRFRGTCRLHLKGRKITRAKSQRANRWLCLPQVFTQVSCSAYSSTLKIEATCSTEAGSPDFTLISCSAYSSVLKMDVTCFSETSVDFQRTTQRYIAAVLVVRTVRMRRF